MKHVRDMKQAFALSIANRALSVRYKARFHHFICGGVSISLIPRGIFIVAATIIIATLIKR